MWRRSLEASIQRSPDAAEKAGAVDGWVGGPRLLTSMIDGRPTNTIFRLRETWQSRLTAVPWSPRRTRVLFISMDMETSAAVDVICIELFAEARTYDPLAQPSTRSRITVSMFLCLSSLHALFRQLSDASFILPTLSLSLSSHNYLTLLALHSQPNPRLTMASQLSQISTVATVAHAASAAATTLLRASPAPAPKGVPRWLAGLIDHTTTLLVLPTLPFAVVQHALYRPQQPLKIWLIAHLLRNKANLAPILEECYSEGEAASIAFKGVLPFPKGLWDDVKCEIISVPPAPAGWAPIDSIELPKPVQPATRPGFMLTPVPRGEKERSSGQLIIHCHGG